MGWLIGFVLIRVETDQRQSCVPGAAKQLEAKPKGDGESPTWVGARLL